jgi:hypothetical protein
MFVPHTHKCFASREFLFHEYAHEDRKEDIHDVWHLPNENDESVKEEYVE